MTYADLIERVASATDTTVAVIEEQKRKQKSIDRIAWKAEAAQRHAKRGNWK